MTSNETDIKLKITARDEMHHILMKVPIHQEYITIINKASKQPQKYEAKMFIIEEHNRQFYNNGVFHVPFSKTYRITRQRFNKEKKDLNNPISYILQTNIEPSTQQHQNMHSPPCIGNVL